MESDETTIGSAVAAQPAASVVTIRVLFEPERSRARPATPLGSAAFSIGRASEKNQLALKDKRASRRHAVLSALGPSSARLEDLSTNGTFVNGERVDGAREVVDGDLIRIGDSFLLIRVMTTHPPRDASIPELLGGHASMRLLRYTITQVAPSDAKVLIIGETGTGKELVARAIHERSRRPGRFVAVNCAAIPESLAESQLFGHVAGAFTGARAEHVGFVRAADGGTLFLDEIGELSPTLQPKLLRALEERQVTPVGSTDSVSVDLRLIAATHRELLEEVDAGRFRGDLYARVAGYLMHTTPLRDRKEDILPLLREVLSDDAPPLAPDLVEALLMYRFRFNVRELKELATQLSIDGAGSPALTLAMVERRLEPHARQAPTPPRAAEKKRVKLPPPTEAQLRALVSEHGRNVSRIARELGRSRRQVLRYLERFGIEGD